MCGSPRSIAISARRRTSRTSSARWAARTISAARDQDLAFLRHALLLAARGLGRTWPNPTVGCVIVRDGRIVAAGRTGDGGRPHAERVALDRAGSLAAGATAYVSLEPCSHHGRTPPCSDALIAAGVARVVAAGIDPDPRVSGQGLERLRAAGIAVQGDLLTAEAAAINAGFFRRVREGRPLLALKLATSLDGRIATATGESRWITGPEARSHGHLLRATHDAILVGIGTALADDPDLTCRLPGLESASPLRILLDSRLRIAGSSRLVQGARRVPLLVLHEPDAPAERRSALRAAGVDLAEVAGGAGGLDPVAVGQELGRRGLTRVLVEGGASVATSFLRAGVIDRVHWYRAGRLIGGDGLPAVGPLGVGALDATPRYVRQAMRELGQDVLETWGRDG